MSQSRVTDGEETTAWPSVETERPRRDESRRGHPLDRGCGRSQHSPGEQLALLCECVAVAELVVLGFGVAAVSTIGIGMAAVGVVVALRDIGIVFLIHVRATTPSRLPL